MILFFQGLQGLLIFVHKSERISDFYGTQSGGRSNMLRQESAILKRITSCAILPATAKTLPRKMQMTFDMQK